MFEANGHTHTILFAYSAHTPYTIRTWRCICANDRNDIGQESCVDKLVVTKVSEKRANLYIY